jgi:hypothetical protein
MNDRLKSSTYRIALAVLILISLFTSCATQSYIYIPQKINEEDKRKLNLEIKNCLFDLNGLDTAILKSGVEIDSNSNVKVMVEFMNESLISADVQNVIYPYRLGGGGTFTILSDGNYYRLYNISQSDFRFLSEYTYFSYTRCKVYISYKNDVFFKYFFNIPSERKGKYETLPYPYESELWAYKADVRNYILSLCLIPAFSNVKLLFEGDVSEKIILLNWIYWFNRKDLIPEITKCRDTSEDERIKNICNNILRKFEKNKK